MYLIEKKLQPFLAPNAYQSVCTLNLFRFHLLHQFPDAGKSFLAFLPNNLNILFM